MSLTTILSGEGGDINGDVRVRGWNRIFIYEVFDPFPGKGRMMKWGCEECERMVDSDTLYCLTKSNPKFRLAGSGF